MNFNGAPWPRMLVGALAVDLMDRERALSLILGSLSAPDPLAVASANLDHVHHFANDPSWLGRGASGTAGRAADGLRWLTLLDGMPLVRTANALSGRRWPKLSGSDLINPILESAAELGLRVGFLGGTAETHRQLRGLVGRRIPAIDVAGTWAPSRSELNDPAASERIAAEIRDAHVDILVVGLGKPRQEEWIARFGAATGARVLLAFGAVVDFLAGRVRRAPERVANAGVEWAWRFAQEPRRLGRRYLVHGPPALVRLKRTARVVEASVPPTPRTDSPPGRFVPCGEYADVAAVVVTYNSAADLPPLIDDLRQAARDHSIRLIVVDNDSSDRTVDLVRAHPDIVLVEAGGNLGYSGAINAGQRFAAPCDALLILNPDLTLGPDAITRLREAAVYDGTGAVVPLMLDAHGTVYPSLRREPSLTRAIGDALLGAKIRTRPGYSSEMDFRPSSYQRAHDVDWATGATLLVPAGVAREIGEWTEEFFLYSEETDYFRRIRESGRTVHFEPSAVVQHRGGGSGTSPALATLMAVNRIRYIERHHGWAYSALFRTAVALGELVRSYDAVHRRTLAVVMSRRRWQDVPCATRMGRAQQLSGPRQRGAVIVPACNEAAVIERTLAPLSSAAVEGFIELVVVCNGCTDNSADVARSVPGVRVVELTKGSKPAALNAGDHAATLWPRLYLDADIQISASAVLEVLDRLREGDVLVARPDSRYDCDGASALVRSYYRARSRIPQHRYAMWGAGAYGLNAKGHQRFGDFPSITADDLYVDTRFQAHEKAVVATDPSMVKTPADVKSLLAILRRNHRGGVELLANAHGADPLVRDTSLRTAAAVLHTIRGPRSAVDAAVYLGMALVGRQSLRGTSTWERDESSRSRI